jgi:2-polyprenyl-6-methoxyphenol hydroxylase and related FAD-dependent oxidoreductases
VEAKKKILICGGGIAGPACAYWLQRYGYAVVIVEKANALREGGQNVDIKGAGQQVIQRMGIAEAIDARNTHEQGVRFRDAAGRVVATFPRGAFAGLTADFEILRGDFARILFDTVKDTCEYRFGRSVAELEEAGDGMVVTFDDGVVEAFELVICAEGIGSSTRDRYMHEITRFRYLGAYMVFFTIPRRPEDDGWASVAMGQGTMLFLRLGKHEETTVLVTFLREQAGATSAADRKALLGDALKGRGTVAERVREELDTVKDFYFGPMSQVQASRWSQGRFVLLGDAGYCPTPFTGEGTALALVGAYLLAGEIRRGTSHNEAFERYEQLLRPYVERSQRALSPRSIRMMHPRSRSGAALARVVLKVLSSRPVQWLFKPNDAGRKKKVAEDFTFPDPL